MGTSTMIGSLTGLPSVLITFKYMSCLLFYGILHVFPRWQSKLGAVVPRGNY